jgi:hypothetical protein
MTKYFKALGARAYPVGMLIVGLLFIPLGIFRYPAFILVGVVYVGIGWRGLSSPSAKSLPSKSSNKTQLESL